MVFQVFLVGGKKKSPKIYKMWSLKDYFWMEKPALAWNEKTWSELWIFNDWATVSYVQIWGWIFATFSNVLHVHTLCIARGSLFCTTEYLNSTKWPFFLLSQEWHPVVRIFLADHIRSWSLVRLNEVWFGNFKGQETLISFRISFSTAVSHCTVWVAELFYLADFIQENGGL